VIEAVGILRLGWIGIVILAVAFVWRLVRARRR
jgi:hypothetical protein